ncbi:MAG TPA: inositol monophosphatase [Terricaulis sp.]|nr:inositol monophosphatase [Terricaulis sp.]
MHDLKELLAIADAAAREAGQALKANRDAWSVIEAEHGREVKIDADKRAEGMILEALERAAPFPIISEEAGWVRAGESRYVWAVDPLDGSVNYLRGYPHCAVSIALLDQGSPVLGVVDCFALGERFTGLVGVGAWLNGAPMIVSDIDTPASGILQTGVPSRASAESMALFDQRLRTWRKVRMIGSAATALAYVAAGRAEAYRESGSMIWDVAGGCALVRAAGGIFEISGGDLDQPLEVSACNNRVTLPE